MEFFKSFAVTMGLAMLLGVSILVMVKGTGLLSMVPFFAYLAGFIYLFARYGCLPPADDHH